MYVCVCVCFYLVHGPRPAQFTYWYQIGWNCVVMIFQMIHISGIYFYDDHFRGTADWL